MILELLSNLITSHIYSLACPQQYIHRILTSLPARSHLVQEGKANSCPFVLCHCSQSWAFPAKVPGHDPAFISTHLSFKIWHAGKIFPPARIFTTFSKPLIFRNPSLNRLLFFSGPQAPGFPNLSSLHAQVQCMISLCLSTNWRI